MGDCKLECKEKGAKLINLRIAGAQGEGGREQHEFIGPVRVLMVETSKHDYRKKTWGAAFVTMAFIALGATFTTVFFFSASYPVPLNNNLHILFFTIGFQLLSPAAFLTMHSYNGAASILKAKTRKQDYGIIKVASLICILVGLIFSFLSKDMKTYPDRVWSTKGFSSHAFTGMLAVVLCLLDLCTLPCLPCNTKRVWPRVGLVMCVPSLILSSVSYILAIQKDKFSKEWLPVYEISYFLIGFCVYYTFFACFDPIRNLKRSTMMKK